MVAAGDAFLAFLSFFGFFLGFVFFSFLSFLLSFWDLLEEVEEDVDFDDDFEDERSEPLGVNPAFALSPSICKNLHVVPERQLPLP